MTKTKKTKQKKKNKKTYRATSTASTSNHVASFPRFIFYSSLLKMKDERERRREEFSYGRREKVHDEKEERRYLLGELIKTHTRTHFCLTFVVVRTVVVSCEHRRSRFCVFVRTHTKMVGFSSPSSTSCSSYSYRNHGHPHPPHQQQQQQQQQRRRRRKEAASITTRRSILQLNSSNDNRYNCKKRKKYPAAHVVARSMRFGFGTATETRTKTATATASWL